MYNSARNALRRPAYDPERIPVEPELYWIESVITPFTRTKGGVYDMANRRWYDVAVERVVTEEDWFVRELRKHLPSIPNQHLNVISIDENGEATFSFKSDISRSIWDMAPYDGPLHKTTLNTISERKYLSGLVDTCEWEGRKVAYKCIEFPGDVQSTFREIQVRETLDPDFTGVAPILAVVVDPKTQWVDGIILPLYDTDMESLANNPSARLRIEDLHRLIQTISHLNDLGIIHGDICERNVVINLSSDCTSQEIALVDFGEVAPYYPGDLEMAAQLLGWCADHFTWTEGEKTKLVTAATRIREGDCANALDILAST